MKCAYTYTNDDNVKMEARSFVFWILMFSARTLRANRRIRNNRTDTYIHVQTPYTQMIPLTPKQKPFPIVICLIATHTDVLSDQIRFTRFVSSHTRWIQIITIQTKRICVSTSFNIRLHELQNYTAIQLRHKMQTCNLRTSTHTYSFVRLPAPVNASRIGANSAGFRHPLMMTKEEARTMCMCIYECDPAMNYIGFWDMLACQKRKYAMHSMKWGEPNFNVNLCIEMSTIAVRSFVGKKFVHS